MIPWNNVFEYFRDRGRVMLFFIGLGLILPLTLVMAVLVVLVNAFGPGYVGAALGLIGFLQVCFWIRRARKQRANRYKISPLSRDEICKARSKLMNRQRS